MEPPLGRAAAPAPASSSGGGAPADSAGRPSIEEVIEKLQKPSRRALEGTPTESLTEAAMRTFPAMKALQREKNKPLEGAWLDKGDNVASQPSSYNLAFVGDLFAATSDLLEEGPLGALSLGPLFAHPTPAERRDGDLDAH